MPPRSDTGNEVQKTGQKTGQSAVNTTKQGVYKTAGAAKTGVNALRKSQGKPAASFRDRNVKSPKVNGARHGKGKPAAKNNAQGFAPKGYGARPNTAGGIGGLAHKGATGQRKASRGAKTAAKGAEKTAEKTAQAAKKTAKRVKKKVKKTAKRTRRIITLPVKVLLGGCLLPFLLILVIAITVFVAVVNLDINLFDAIAEDKGELTAAGYYGSTETSANGVPAYYQSDYGDVPFNTANGSGKTVASSGCGVTSFAMIASYLLGQSITPREVAPWCDANGANTVTSWGAYEKMAEHWGLKIEKQGSGPLDYGGSIDTIVGELRQGKVLLCSVRGAPYNPSGRGHYIVLTGITANGNILVNDPGSRERTQQSLSGEGFSRDTLSTCRQYWIFAKK